MAGMAQGTGWDTCCPPWWWLPMLMLIAFSWSKLSPGPACLAGRALPDPPKHLSLEPQDDPSSLGSSV